MSETLTSETLIALVRGKGTVVVMLPAEYDILRADAEKARRTNDLYFLDFSMRKEFGPEWVVK
jgi:hypothetical protein